MKRLTILAALIVFTCFGLRAALAFEGGDTGTYRILDYKVSLTPHTDGTVSIDYYQQWQVTAGHIPWMTIGAPGSDFTITAWSMAAKSAYADGEYIHINLDKDYQSGETFKVSVSIAQNRLFYAQGSSYHLNFTPGWYDRAEIDNLEIRIKPFAKISDITSNPVPSPQTEEELVWTKQNLSPGEQFKVSISFPKVASSKQIPDENLRDSGQDNYPATTSDYGGAIFLFIVFVVIVVMIIALKFGAGGGYSGGSMWFGGLGGGSGGGSSSDRSSSGGGGFGGSGYSCACACVSCACACACAGGGGAGCSRKQEHRCPACDREEDEE